MLCQGFGKCRRSSVSGQEQLRGLGFFYTGGSVLYTDRDSFDMSEMFPVSGNNPIVELTLEYDQTLLQ